MLLSYIIWSMYFIGETLRRGERTWSDYWNQFLGNIISYPITSKEPPDSIIYSTENDRASKRLLILGLMDISSKASSVLNIYLIGERILNMKLRKDRYKDYILRISKLSDSGLHQVRYVLEIIPLTLINKGDTNPIILDTGFSKSATGFRYDLVEGNLV